MDTRHRLGAFAAGMLTLWTATQVAAVGRQAPEAGQGHRQFTPPADGKLTSDQVKMYIAVRRRAVTAIAPSGESLGDPSSQIARLAASLTSEAKAVADLGADVDEYRWVGARIAEADAAAGTGDKVLDSIIAAINAANETVGSAVASQPQPAAAAEIKAARVTYNRQLLARYRSDLEALRRTPRP